MKKSLRLFENFYYSLAEKSGTFQVFRDFDDLLWIYKILKVLEICRDFKDFQNSCQRV